MRGGSLEALKEILGQGSMVMTFRHAHLVPEHVRGEMERTARAHEAHPARQSIFLPRVRPTAYTDQHIST